MKCETCGRENNCLHKTKISNKEIYFLIAFIMVVSQGLSSLYNSTESFDSFNVYYLGAFALITINVTFLFAYIIFDKQYLALFYGCHQLVERSFSFSNGPFVICARCSGILFGIFVSFFFPIIRVPLYTYFFFMIPLLVDGLIQQKTEYKSNSYVRFITGLLFAPGFVYLFGLVNVYFHQGFRIAASFLLDLIL